MNRSDSIRTVVAAVLFCQSVPAQTAHLGNGVRLMEERKFAEAATEFEAGLAGDPNNDALRIQYATCLYLEERNDESARQFELERKRLGDKPGITYYLGLLDVRARNYAGAIAKLQPLESNAAFPKASFYLGMAYLGAGESTAAMESLQRAAKNNPQDSDVHYRLARVYTTAGRTAEADREFALYRSTHENERIVEQEAPACMEALRAGPRAEAKAICERIGDPHDARRLLLLGRLYAGVGDYADAIPPLEQASKLSPDLFEVWHFLGVSLYGLQRYPEALTALRKAEALNPQFFETVNLLAKTLYIQGDYKAALPVLERAHNLNPDDAQLAAVLERLRASLSDRK